LAIVLTLALIASLTVIVPALASHGNAELPGSNFEIDDDANLKLDDAEPSVDWGTLAHPNGPELRATDAPTGQNDDSSKGGVKEDTECPGAVTGSIPNNKSDLLTFHVYEEAGSEGHPGFLNLAWSRVSDPSGTTLMDFEFNQASVSDPADACPQGPNVKRTAGDLLVEYAIVQGGARAELTKREWNGTAWGAAVDIDAPNVNCPDENDVPGPCAVGTINSTAIPDADSDGLGAKQPRTFGEAQIDLRLIFDEGSCNSFGTAMLKSRSSDAFNSQLKDFIEPVGISLTNCAKVIIRKQTDPDGATAEFGFTKAFPVDADPAPADTFTLSDDGSMTFENVLFGTDLTVTEDVLPGGWAFDRVDCDAGNVTPTSVVGATVTFDLDDADDVLDCTYFNEQQVGAIKVTKTRKHADSGPGDHAHPGVEFTVNGVEKNTDANGVACFDGLTFGAYDVVETVPSGYIGEGGSKTTVTKSVTVDNIASCDDDPYGGETVSFSNTPLTDLSIDVTAQDPGATKSSITCVDSTDTSIGGNGNSFSDPASLDIEDLEPGTYSCTIVVDP
jgi:hypothetical protein